MSELLERLASKDWRLAAQTAQALREAGDEGFRVAMTGLADPRPRIRRAAADWFDHHGDDRCVVGLTERLLNDPVPRVRRAAVHSLGCDRCKESPLAGDRVPLLIQVIERDDNMAVRREAIYAFFRLAPDPRVVPVLRAVLAETPIDRRLFLAAHSVLRLHDPEYRRESDARARVAQEGSEG